MKKIYLLLFCVMKIAPSYGQSIINACNWPSILPIFDLNNRDTVKKYFYIDSSQTNNIWQIGAPSKIVFDSAHSKPIALVTDTLNAYPNNNTSSFTFIVHTNTNNCNWSSMSFWHRYNTDSLADGGVIEYSIDGGITWNNIINSSYNLYNFYSSSSTISSNSNKPGFTGNSGWVCSYFIGPIQGNFVLYRFTFTSDNTNTNKDGWMIDDIKVGGASVGINDIEANSAIQVFPNPTSDYITIKTNNTSHFKSATITDIIGQEILTSNKTTIDLLKFKAGIYFVSITTDKEKFVVRILKQ